MKGLSQEKKQTETEVTRTLEPTEYDRIAEKYLDSVYRATLTYCKNKENAEDAVQNAFIKLFSTDTVFTDDEHIKKWLIRTAINDCKNVFVSFRSKKVISIDELDTEPSYIEHDADTNELFGIITTLPQNYRTVIYLYYYEGYSVKEIAEIVGTSESNVQNRLMRARKKLESMLKKEDWI